MDIVVSGGPREPLTNVDGFTAPRPKRAAQGRLQRRPGTTAARRRSNGSRDRNRTARGHRRAGRQPGTLLVSSGPAPVRVPDVIGQHARRGGSDADERRTGARHGQHKRPARRRPAPCSRSPRPPAPRARRRRRRSDLAQAPKEIGRPQRRRQRAGGRGGGARTGRLQGQNVDPRDDRTGQLGIVLEQSPAGGARAARARPSRSRSACSRHRPRRRRPPARHDDHADDARARRRRGPASVGAHGRALARALTVAVLAGGRSSEHDVSLSSGAAVRDGLLRCGPRGPCRRDRPRRRVAARRRAAQRHARAPGCSAPMSSFRCCTARSARTARCRACSRRSTSPYVGAGVTASAVCLDKVLFKQLMSAVGVPQVDYVGVRAERFEPRPSGARRARRLGLPVFVKPAHLGSSLGIVKVSDADALAAALERAFDARRARDRRGDGTRARGRVRRARSRRRARASRPSRARSSSKATSTTSSAKYSPGGDGAADTRARSRRARASTVRRAGAGARSRRAGCEGLARVDFFVDGERVLVNELNTMPGFTPTSVYAKLLDASGIAYPAATRPALPAGAGAPRQRHLYSY